MKKEEGSIILSRYESDALLQIDAVAYPAIPDNQNYSRLSDGNDN